MNSKFSKQLVTPLPPGRHNEGGIMMRALLIFSFLFAGTPLFGCSGASGSTPPAQSPDSIVDSESGRQDHGEPKPGEGGSGSTTSSPSPNPLIDSREPDPKRGLPELSFRHLGMHIGGESNSPKSKAPFLSAISEQEEAILNCYRLVDRPGKPGSFGLDLFVGRQGGAPEIRGVRQKIGDESFVACMRSAFLRVEFEKPERPTVLSYSLLFVLDQDDS